VFSDGSRRGRASVDDTAVMGHVLRRGGRETIYIYIYIYRVRVDIYILYVYTVHKTIIWQWRQWRQSCRAGGRWESCYLLLEWSATPSARPINICRYAPPRGERGGRAYHRQPPS